MGREIGSDTTATRCGFESIRAKLLTIPQTQKELDSRCRVCMPRVGDRMGRIIVNVTPTDRIIAHL